VNGGLGGAGHKESQLLPMRVISGQHGEYFWVEAPELTLHALISAFPDVVRGRRVAITSFDSGAFRPNSEELAAGWQELGTVALSPVVQAVKDLPTGGYDEWYVDATLPVGFEPQVFINYGGFSLRSPDYIVDELRPTWDRQGAQVERDRILEQQAQFWSQLERLRPTGYLAEGDLLIYVARDTRLFQLCTDWCHAALEKG
jgi:hypothetical protein